MVRRHQALVFSVAKCLPKRSAQAHGLASMARCWLEVGCPEVLGCSAGAGVLSRCWVLGCPQCQGAMQAVGCPGCPVGGGVPSVPGCPAGFGVLSRRWGAHSAGAPIGERAGWVQAPRAAPPGWLRGGARPPLVGAEMFRNQAFNENKRN